MKAKSNPAVFLDRDGTILNERGYLADPKNIRFYSYSFAALRLLAKYGYKLVVVTNQSGVERGYFSLGKLNEIHGRFRALLKAKGVRLHGIYYCPHLPTAGCRCRKPKPFLVNRAAKELKLDLKKSYVIGDQARDIELANRSKTRGVLVLTGAGRSQLPRVRKSATHVARNLSTAANWIVRNT